MRLATVKPGNIPTAHDDAMALLIIAVPERVYRDFRERNRFGDLARGETPGKCTMAAAIDCNIASRSSKKYCAL
ncbi:hypothetical protein DMH17_13580 [Raoultella planticola]|nr:hypothetical protein [Raoultella planticola]